MFISLNKKILYSILVFLFVITCLFFLIFINFYARNLKDRQNSLYLRNQYVVDLLYDNISLQKQLAEIYEKYPNALPKYRLQSASQGIDLTQKELSKEQQLNAELQKNYNNNKEAIKVGAQIIGFSLFIVVLFIFRLLLCFLPVLILCVWSPALSVLFLPLPLYPPVSYVPSYICQFLIRCRC